MKCKDLQLGDWVRIYDIEQQELRATGKIWEIRQEDVTVDTDGTEAGMWYCTDQCLYPIAITHEILDKNEWEYKSGIWFKRGPIRLGWYERNKQLIIGYHTYPAVVEYAHEMQRIQRLLGLEEMTV